MPLFHIEIKCMLENISSLSSIPNNSWVLDVSDPTETEVRSNIVVSPEETIELDNHEVNFEISFGGKKKGKQSNKQINKLTMSYAFSVKFKDYCIIPIYL